SGGDRMIILCATDFSDLADAAEQRAVELARTLSAELMLVHVAVETPLYAEQPFSMRNVPDVYESQRKWAAGTLGEHLAAARARGISVRTVVRTGVPSDEIVRTATDEAAEMIVMGTHGRTGVARAILGSVAAEVIRAAPCPVLTVGPGVTVKR